jgi:hypothetical protein
MRRRSIRSANAPAGSENRNTGNVVAACTNATITGDGDGDSIVINQPAHISCIQLPTLEISVAPHNTANTECRSGVHAECFAGSFVFICYRHRNWWITGTATVTLVIRSFCNQLRLVFCGRYAFFTNSDFNCIAPMPSILQSIS